tara:strand:+ start:35374 stop:36714 length:1341 start_codon:yes stop_codon:yes gene_type:complete
MLSKIENHLTINLPFLKDKKLLIAVSGGIDSNVLIALFHELKYDISMAHCNFHLRGKESVLDEESLKKIAADLNIVFHSISFETEAYAKKRKISIQLAARELRYDWFEKIKTEKSYDYILTAHHKNDVLETFLINFTRGTGLDGLTSIPTINGAIVRPLLPFTRDEILKYALDNNIAWREDESNTSIKYARNKIRHQVIPVLQELNPSLLNTFEHTLEHLKGSQQLIANTVSNLREKVISAKGDILQISIEEIKKMSVPKPYLFELLKPYNFKEWDDVFHLLNAQSGKQIFSKTHRLLKDRKFLFLTEIDTKSNPTSYTLKEFVSEYLTHDLKLEFSIKSYSASRKNQKNKVFIDADTVKFPLIMRKWKNGDIFTPLGFRGKKKLSDYFKDEKMSLIEKERTWILTNTKNEIIWILGKRIDDKFKTSSNTEHMIELSCSMRKKLLE